MLRSIVCHTRVEGVSAILEHAHGEVESVVVERSLCAPAVASSQPLLCGHVVEVVDTALERRLGLCLDGFSRHRHELHVALVAAHDSCDRECLLRPHILLAQHAELVVHLHGVFTLHGVVVSEAVDELGLTELHQLREDVVVDRGQRYLLRCGSALSDDHLVEVGAVVCCELRNVVVGSLLSDDGSVEHLSLLEVEACVVEDGCSGGVLHVDVAIVNLRYVGVGEREAHGAVLWKGVECGDIFRRFECDDLHLRLNRLFVGVGVGHGDGVDLALLANRSGDLHGVAFPLFLSGSVVGRLVGGLFPLLVGSEHDVCDGASLGSLKHHFATVEAQLWLSLNSPEAVGCAGSARCDGHCALTDLEDAVLSDVALIALGRRCGVGRVGEVDCRHAVGRCFPDGVVDGRQSGHCSDAEGQCQRHCADDVRIEFLHV